MLLTKSHCSICSVLLLRSKALVEKVATVLDRFSRINRKCGQHLSSFVRQKASFSLETGRLCSGLDFSRLRDPLFVDDMNKFQNWVETVMWLKVKFFSKILIPLLNCILKLHIALNKTTIISTAICSGAELGWVYYTFVVTAWPTPRRPPTGHHHPNRTGKHNASQPLEPIPTLA